MLYAGNNLARAREVFTAAIKHRPRISLTITARPSVWSRYVLQRMSGFEQRDRPRHAVMRRSPAGTAANLQNSMRTTIGIKVLPE